MEGESVIKRLSFFLALVSATSAHAQTWTQMQWFFDKSGGYPYPVSTMVGATNITIGSLTSGGKFSPNGAPTFSCGLSQFVTSGSLGSFVCATITTADIAGLAPSATIDTTDATNITSGILAAARGGTGIATFPTTSTSPPNSGTRYIEGSGAFSAGNCAQFDANGRVVDAAGPCGGGGGSGTVSAGTSGEIAYYGTSGTTVTGATHFTISGGVATLGDAGDQGGVQLKGGTSGTISINPQAAAGTYNFNLPTGAGNSGDVLTSAGGGASAMTWTALGTAAFEDTGTSGSTIPLLNGANTWASAQIVPSLGVKGSSSGTVTIAPQAAAGTYNFNLPTTAGTSGQVLTSAGGGASAMTWTTLGTAATKNTGTSGTVVPLLDGANTWTGGQTFAAFTTTDSAIVGSSPVASTTPGRVSPSPTGNTTNGSATITNLSAVSSDWVGYEISGTGIPSCTSGLPADSARATIDSVNVGASTLTMSCAANATNTGVTLGIGRDYYSSGNSFTTRTIGAESAMFGDAATGQNVSWMNDYFAGWGGNNPQTTTGITLTPPDGGTTGMIVGARSSTAASQRIFGERSFVVSDGLPLDATNPRTWNYYGVGYALAATDNVLSQATFMEAEVYNEWTARDKNPYTTTLGVVGDYQAGCGAGSGGNSCSYAFLVFGNGATFLEGIVFHNAALSTTLDGTLGYAVHMGANQALHWSKSSGVEGGSIWADTNGDLKLRAASGRTTKAESAFELKQSTVASIETCDTPRKFSLVAVTDLNVAAGYTSTSYNLRVPDDVGGGGTTAAMLFCDGSKWRIH